MSPRRIQRRRTKGWRTPEGAVYVGRPAKWGNPFAVGEPITHYLFDGVMTQGVPLRRQGVVADRAHAVELYAFWVMATVPFKRDDVRRELAGHDLACWCPLDQPCHADLLLEIANGGAS